MTFADWLNAFVDANYDRRTTQAAIAADLSARVGIDPPISGPTLARYLNGKQEPRARMMRNWYEALGGPPETKEPGPPSGTGLTRAIVALTEEIAAWRADLVGLRTRVDQLEAMTDALAGSSLSSPGKPVGAERGARPRRAR